MTYKYIKNSATCDYEYINNDVILEGSIKLNEVNIKVTFGNLTIYKSVASKYFGRNEPILYTLIVSNNTNIDMYNIKIKDNLGNTELSGEYETKFKYIKNSATAIVSNEYVEVRENTIENDIEAKKEIQIIKLEYDEVLKNIISITIPFIKAFEVAIINFKVSVPIDYREQVYNTAKIESGFLKNDIDNKLINIEVESEYSYNLDNDTEEIIRTVTLKNLTGIDLYNVIVEDTLPTYLTYANNTTISVNYINVENPETYVEYPVEGTENTLDVLISKLDVDNVATIIYKLNVGEDYKLNEEENICIKSAGVINENLPQLYTSNKVNAEYKYANVTVFKTIKDNVNFDCGENIDIKITVGNSGNRDAKDLKITDLVQSEFEFLSEDINDNIYISQSSGDEEYTINELKNNETYRTLLDVNDNINANVRYGLITISGINVSCDNNYNKYIIIKGKIKC